METFPIAPKKRRIIEMNIRITDLLAYTVIFLSGVAAMFFTPDSVVLELLGYEWLIPYWASMLLLGGSLGFTARLTTIWIMEPAAAVLSMFGIAIYFIVLGKTAFSSITAVLASCLIFVAILWVIRRYLELQLFGSNPEHKDFRSKLRDAFMRRIPNVPPRG